MQIFVTPMNGMCLEISLYILIFSLLKSFIRLVHTMKVCKYTFTSNKKHLTTFSSHRFIIRYLPNKNYDLSLSFNPTPVICR